MRSRMRHGPQARYMSDGACVDNSASTSCPVDPLRLPDRTDTYRKCESDNLLRAVDMKCIVHQIELVTVRVREVRVRALVEWM